jgi:Cu(I)/Ag(I) efflux system membrane fusion protein
MKKFLYVCLLVLFLFGSFLAGSLYSRRDARRINSLNAKSPAVSLENKADTNSLPPGGSPDSTAPGAVRITPEKQQVIGVRTAVVEKSAVSHAIRTVGRVAPDEKRVYRLVAGTDGWIRETYDNDTGTLVKKDERLASFYSPQFRTTQINYLSVLGSSPDERYDAGRRQALAPSQLATVSIKTYIDALESLGMSEQQIKELASTRQVTDKVFIVAPATGFIIARNVSPGQRFEKGTEWYRIADLTKVWVLADLFRNEAEYVRPGMKVRVTIPETRKTLSAVVSTVLPQFDAASRTMKVRLELDNPGYTLRPDMFVDVEFPVILPSALTAPTDAILDSGLRKTVFVDQGSGLFEPREVETGWRLGNRVEITKGLAAGEKIAMSGTFLIDSESRMELAAAGMVGTLAKDPVCDADVSVNKAEKAGRKSKYKDVMYYFSSDECKQKFDNNPQQYTKK